jgi:hypothetical protein
MAKSQNDLPQAGQDWQRELTKAEIRRQLDSYIGDLRAIERSLCNVPHRAYAFPEIEEHIDAALAATRERLRDEGQASSVTNARHQCR